MSLMALEIAVPWLVVSLFTILGAWLGFQLVHQNGRLLSHLEGLEQRLAALAARPQEVPAPAQPAPRGPPPAADAARQNAAPPPQQAVAPQAPQGLPLGTPAPAFALPDLRGQRRSLADFRGQKLLLLFFNPGCGFCTRMA